MSDRPNNEPIEARESQRSDSSSSESASLRLHEDAYALSERNEEDRSASDNNTLSSTESDTTSNSTEKEESRTNPLDFGLHDVEIVDGSDPNAENNTELAGQSRENQEKTRELEPEKEVDEAGEATEIKDKDLDKQIKEFEQYLGGFENIDGERAGQVGEHLRQTFNRLERHLHHTQNDIRLHSPRWAQDLQHRGCILADMLTLMLIRHRCMC